MSDVQCTVEGLDDLEKKLTDLIPAQARTALRRGVRSGTLILENAISAAAPRLTGMLSNSFIVRSSTTASENHEGAVVTGKVKVDTHAFRYAEGAFESISGPSFIIVGKKTKRIILGKEGRALKNPYHWAHLEARFYELGTKHQPARPFMRPAAENNQGASVNALIEEVNAEFAKYS